MSVIYVALPIALLLGAAGMLACVRCIRDGQYDDLDTPPLRILSDDCDLSHPQTAAEDLPDSPNSPAANTDQVPTRL